MFLYFLAFTISLVIVLITIPPIRKLAFKIDFVDKPSKRKIHKIPVPQLASISIFLGFFITFWIFNDQIRDHSIPIFMGSLLIIGIGLVDDWFKTKGKEFPAWPKAAVQLLAAVLIYYSGIVFTGFTNPMSGEYIILPAFLQFALTVLWIFGVTTVINFMDGLDGLTGGITTISAITLFIVALFKGQQESAILSIILLGTTLGYLKYNKPPAKIYMGDAGATFLGYMLAIISLNGAFKQATLLSILIPILVLSVPIFDNLYVIIKRFLQGKPIYIADRSQIHYRLISKGLNPKQSTVFIFLLSTCFSLLAIIVLLIDSF
ncbi:undecaprenyl/decaprenyl-phosphate alpha-N-acetylglucosaminyl 1-phosphate transferase [Heyndrickxia oleronia]|uniref:MraY family glycosyltransferase n=1 Tax=Heyndrickxia oleronia TaxID=38875 RepID=A0AAW6SRJ0_9BACI|nr:MraY family glycosyltransferase [Heyndrickxia oleronia]MCM3236404.1 undecaprenyl/decaprenyl-phosphate alpha-N-acetylglucosaminyl 1-phosphate transferase [Heyndrickxia oleronia]MDH5159432.1 MraY family glycosyltransferase [Heyndrickxia oleronia]